MTEPVSNRVKCETCKARLKHENNPRGFWGRLWKWHTRWCPGWKKYQQELARGAIAGQKP